MNSWRHRVLPGLLVAIVAAAALAATGPVQAQESRSDTLLTTEHYLDWERVNDAQISPDGARVLYTRQHVNKLEDKWDSELWIVNADGAQNRFFAKGSAARWSPDGKPVPFSMFVAEKNTLKIDMPEEPKGAKWTSPPRLVATLHYRQDQIG